MTYRRWLNIIFASLLLVVLVIAAGMVFMYWIVNQPGYAERIGDPLIPINEKAYTLSNQSCDLLVFGDSSTTTGIDPRVLAKNGISVCDISATAPIVSAFGTMTVDVFLAHNPRPKILLLQFSPETFYREQSWEHLALLTPVTLLLRKASFPVAVSRLLTHLSAVVRVEEIVIKQHLYPAPPAEQERLQGVFERTMKLYNESGGMVAFEQSPQTRCDSPPDDIFAPVDKAWIEQQRRRYQALGMIVIIRSSPIPPCDPQLEMFRRDLDPYLDVKLQTMPINLFLPGDRHLTPAGAEVESQELARQIKVIAAGAAANGSDH